MRVTWLNTLADHSKRYRIPALYVTCDGILNSVFDSQVYSYIQGLRARGIDVTLVAFSPPSQIRSPAFLEKQRDVSDGLDGNALFLAGSPNLGRLTAKIDATRLKRVVNRVLRNREGIVHARGPWASWMAIRAGAKRVIADFRGDREAQYRLYENIPIVTGFKIRAIRGVEREVCVRASTILCVSEALADFLVAARGAQKSDIHLIPTCVDLRKFNLGNEVRAQARSELGLGADFVVAYCGGATGWNCAAKQVEAFSAVRNLVPNAKFLAITPDEKRMRALLTETLPRSDWRVKSAKHVEIPRLLAAADLGLLIRDPNPVNAVASPTKFAEYLACGVPVVVSPGIGDTERIVREWGCGALWGFDKNMLSIVKSILHEREKMSSACVGAVHANFDLDLYLDRLASIYTGIPENIVVNRGL